MLFRDLFRQDGNPHDKPNVCHQDRLHWQQWTLARSRSQRGGIQSTLWRHSNDNVNADLILTIADCAEQCNDAKLKQDDNQWTCLGEPTEGALLVLAKKLRRRLEAGQDGSTLLPPINQVSNMWMDQLSTADFDRQRKCMSVLCTNKASNANNAHMALPRYINSTFVRLFVKGAPDALLPKCINSTPQLLHSALASEQRIIAMAYKDVPRQEYEQVDDIALLENDLTFPRLDCYA